MNAHLQLMKALRVLVIEDDALIAILLAELLASMGHDVCATAATAAEAVNAATRYDPDLMIVDAGLGRESGVSVVEEILTPGGASRTCVCHRRPQPGLRAYAECPGSAQTVSGS
jgi:CheY-like chemotaxis protein